MILNIFNNFKRKKRSLSFRNRKHLNSNSIFFELLKVLFLLILSIVISLIIINNIDFIIIADLLNNFYVKLKILSPHLYIIFSIFSNIILIILLFLLDFLIITTLIFRTTKLIRFFLKRNRRKNFRN